MLHSLHQADDGQEGQEQTRGAPFLPVEHDDQIRRNRGHAKHQRNEHGAQAENTCIQVPAQPGHVLLQGGEGRPEHRRQNALDLLRRDDGQVVGDVEKPKRLHPDELADDDGSQILREEVE